MLHEERALILGKQGSHEKALAIYIFQLHNTDKAEHYCTNLYEEDPENNKIVRLIVVYFKSFLFNFSNYILLTLNYQIDLEQSVEKYMFYSKQSFC